MWQQEDRQQFIFRRFCKQRWPSDLLREEEEEEEEADGRLCRPGDVLFWVFFCCVAVRAETHTLISQLGASESIQPNSIHISEDFKRSLFLM